MALGSKLKQKVKTELVGGRFSDLARYSDLFRRTSDGILLIDPETHEILECNPSAMTLFRKTECELESQPVTEILGGPSVWQALQARLGSAMDWGSEQILELSLSPLQIADYGEVLQLITRDVTALREASRKLETLSVTDELTGLSNVRAFRARLALEMERHQKAEKNASREFSILMLDVDHFKHFNDRNGHPAGDEALRRVAQVLRGASGRDFFPARYGGEEFVAILSPGGLAAAVGRADSIREQIAKLRIPFGEFQPLGFVSVSIGVATAFPGDTAEALLARADQALYESKRAGRNRVTSQTNHPHAEAKKKSG